MAFLCTAVADGDTPPARAGARRPGRGLSLCLSRALSVGTLPQSAKKSRISSLAYLRGFDFSLLFILNTYK